jgi:hypothetical protein
LDAAALNVINVTRGECFCGILTQILEGAKLDPHGKWYCSKNILDRLIGEIQL